MANIDTLIEDIEKSITEGADCSEDLVNAIASTFADQCHTIFKSLVKGKRQAQAKRLRASNIGKPCARAVWYDINGEHDPEELRANTLLKFTFGHILEELLLSLAVVAGHEVSEEQKEHNINGVKGHQDARIDGVLVDVKSASSYAYKKFEANDLNPSNDSFGYLKQIAFYRQGNERVAFFVVDKQNGSICLSTPAPEYLAYDMQYEVERMQHALSKPIPPSQHFQPEPEGKSGNMKLCVECSYCSHKWECWEGLRGFAYATKPVFLTKVVKEPKVPEITNGANNG